MKKNKGYPSRREARKIWEQGIEYRRNRPYDFTLEPEYRFHTTGVATAAYKIAKHIKGLNADKAYVFGLLHDYGKRVNEKIEHRFHGREGYEEMMKMGYPDVAKICLTHTFSCRDFDDDDYNYPKEWKDWVHEKFSQIEYDDYDYLICLCDKFFEGMLRVSIERRIDGIVKRYNLGSEQRKKLTEQSYFLKNYFDKKTGTDIYKILGIED